MNDFDTVRKALKDRQPEFGAEFPPWFFALELAGEAGEAANKAKKIERQRLNSVGSRTSIEELAEELADTILSAINTAEAYGIDIRTEVEHKFNHTSNKYGMKTFLTLESRNDAA